MIISGGTTLRSETVGYMTVSLCRDYESGGWCRVQVTDQGTGERHTTGLIDPQLANEMLEDDQEGFVASCAEELEVVALQDLFEE